MPNSQIASAAHKAKADEYCTTKCAGSQGVHGRTLACHARRGGSLPPETAKHVAVDLLLNKWEDVITVNNKGQEQMKKLTKKRVNAQLSQEFLGQIQQEGYEVVEQDGEFLLVDLLGKFIDSRHNDQQSMVSYCERNVLTFLD